MNSIIYWALESIALKCRTFSLRSLLVIGSPHLTKEVQNDIDRTRAHVKQQHKEGNSIPVTYMFEMQMRTNELTQLSETSVVIEKVTY